jgi:hypothetical protein
VWYSGTTDIVPNDCVSRTQDQGRELWWRADHKKQAKDEG